MIYATGPLGFSSWATNGIHFIYTDASPNPQIGQYGFAPTPLASMTKLIDSSWVDESRFFFHGKNGANYELWLGAVGGPSTIIDSTPGSMINYDFSE